MHMEGRGAAKVAVRQRRKRTRAEEDRAASPGVVAGVGRLSPADVMHLQRLAGNAAVASLIAGQRPAGSRSVQRVTHKIVEDDDQEAEKRKAPVVQRAPGKDPKVVAPPQGAPWVAGKHVAPSFVVRRPSPKRSNSAASTTASKTPTFKGGPRIDAAANVWRHQIDSVESKGTIQIVYYSKSHYPAPAPPDDSGPLSNVTEGNHQEIIDDLVANRTGIADDWSAYRAEVLHEDYHWDTEWKGAVTPRIAQAETDIEALSVGFDKARTARKAESTLKPKAKALFAARMNEARRAYNALGDDAGDPPYVAQAPAIDNLVNRVRNHAATKGW